MSDPSASAGRPADLRRMTFDDNALLAVLYVLSSMALGLGAAGLVTRLAARWSP